MLNKDAKEVDLRILSAEQNLKSDYVIGDTEIIKGLEIVRSFNKDVNADTLLEDEVSIIEKYVNNYISKKNENYICIPALRRYGIKYGLTIVHSVAKHNIKVKTKGNK